MDGKIIDVIIIIIYLLFRKQSIIIINTIKCSIKLGDRNLETSAIFHTKTKVLI